jgi:ATP adenylyltransferase/5',5'''-P-1,P-4-tetraphosphate phosphorylase II
VSAFDLTAARASRREASGANPFVFSWDGKEHTVAPSKEWPVEAVSLLTDGEVVAALQMILTPQVYKSLKGLTIGDVEVLFNALAEHEGLSLGNSSPRASRGTAPKRKR